MERPQDLETPFSQLNVTKDFTEQAAQLGFSTLQDVLDADFNRIKQHKDFTYVWYGDLLSLLKQKGLMEQFQEKQL
jgi:hypothetical protein